MSKTKATSTKKPQTKKPQTKKAQATGIYRRMIARKVQPSRAEIIDELVSKVGLTSNGAATYFQNLSSGKWS